MSETRPTASRPAIKVEQHRLFERIVAGVGASPLVRSRTSSVSTRSRRMSLRSGPALARRKPRNWRSADIGHSGTIRPRGRGAARYSGARPARRCAPAFVVEGTHDREVRPVDLRLHDAEKAVRLQHAGRLGERGLHSVDRHVMQRAEEEHAVHRSGIRRQALRSRLEKRDAGRRFRLPVFRRLDRVGLDGQDGRAERGEFPR